MQAHAARNARPGTLLDGLKEWVGIEGNNQYAPKGYIHRPGLGVTKIQPNAIEIPSVPIQKVFLEIDTNAVTDSVAVNLGKAIENVRRVRLHRVKLTGIVGAHNIMVISTRNSTNALTFNTVTNISTTSPDSLILPCDGAATLEREWNDPILIETYHLPIKFNSVITKVTDTLGNKIQYGKLYMWLYVEMDNFQ